MIYKNNDITDIPVILIVDDNPQNLQVLGKQLQEQNYEIEFAIDGKAAIEWIENKRFDLILLDINMPGISGYEVCQQIRTKKDYEKIPIIFLSAETERESILKGFDLGAQDYITKPFNSRELIARVRTHLILKQSLEKLENLNKTLEQKVQERTQQLRELNTQLEATNIKLRNLDRTKSDFLNIISHEIRTPLNGIVGPLELLKAPVYANEIGDLVEMLDISVRRLERFSLDALLLTRLKTMPKEFKKQKIILPKLIREILNEYKKIAEEKNIKTYTEFSKECNNITGETELLKKAISIILENSYHVSPIDSTVNIKTYPKDHYVICEINDQGPGFSSNVKITLDDFFTIGDNYTDNRRGIGLPIAKMIMDLHGGDIIPGDQTSGGSSLKLAFANPDNENQTSK
jgi:two-component system, sensor histidine kinase and response regulator